MKLVLPLLAILLLPHCRASDVIPPSGRITWQGAVGVPGGVPTYSTIFSNMTAIDATGATAVDTFLQYALTSCPTGQVVKLPAGVFLITNGISLGSGVVLRGAGASTVIKWAKPGDDTGACISIGASVGGDAQWHLATASATKGATTLTVTNIQEDGGGYSLTVGNVLAIEQLNDNVLVVNSSDEGAALSQDFWYGNDYLLAQLFEITGISGTNISISPPLNWTWTNSLNVRLHQKGNGVFVSGAGVEDLCVTNSQATGKQNLVVQFAKRCWLKNVESANCNKFHVETLAAFQCEIRDGYFHGAQGSGSGGNYGIVLNTGSAFNLVENNIINDCICAMMLADMAQGNVFGYNYSPHVQYSPTNWLQADLSGHDCHPMMNLFEGNVGHMLIADHIHGSSSHNTVFRNYLPGWQAGTTSQNRAVALDNYCTYWNIVGNICGSTNLTFLLSTNGPNVLAMTTPVLFAFGYQSISGGAYVDANVFPSTTLLGNYCLGAGAPGVPAAQSIGATNLDSSLYLAAKPAWWGDWPWPAIDARTGSRGIIPPEARYLGLSPSGVRLGTVTNTYLIVKPL